ncbi:MAG: divalent-cation tolerance protein CutA [Terriglobia bacterium]
MTNKIVVLVTVGNAREARKIAQGVIESRLAACVNITPAVRSLYRWKGKIVDDRELLLIIKTTRGHFGDLKEFVLSNHSYSTPEVIALPVIDGSLDYLQWIEKSVGRTGNRE